LSKGSHNGGRVQAMAINPTNPNQVFAASENGGLWESSNGGNLWSHVDALPFWQDNDVAIAASDPNLVIVTGNYDGRTSSEGGIWRSTDGGATWSKPATADPSCTSQPSAYGIAIAPGVPGSLNIWVGDSCGVAYSSDSGATWTHFALPGISGGAWDVTVRPAGSTFQVDACGSQGVSQSTSGGATASAFAALTNPVPSGGFGPCTIATAPQTGQILFTTHYAGVSSGFCVPQFQQSIDGGTTWVDMGPSNDNCRQPWVVTHPDIGGDTSKFEVYEGTGQQLVYQQCSDTVGCTAGTSNWTTITNGSHSDTSDIVFDPSVPNGCPLLLSSDGGVYRTTVPPSSCASTYAWTDSDSGLHAYEATGLAATVNPATTDIYFGSQDNGMYYTGNQGATYTSGGPDVYNVYADTSSPPAARVMWRSCFGCGVSIADAGLASPSAFPLPPGYDVPDNFEATQFGHKSYAFITSDGAVSSTNSSAGPNWKMEVTTNEGATWSQMGPDPLPGSGPVGPLQASGPPSSPTFYWLLNSGSGSQIERLSGALNSTATATNVSSALNNPSTFAVDPSNPDLLYAYDLTFAGGEVMRSTDGGATWTEDVALTNLVTLGGQFETDSAGPLVQYISFDPNTQTIMVDALSGVFYSLDGGASWSILNGAQQLNNASGFFFDSRTDDTYLATYGRGLWQIDPLTSADTSLSGGGQSGAVITVPTHTAVMDSATLNGINAAAATGSVTYNVYSDSNCTDLVSAGTAETITTPGALPASSPVVLDTPATYYWQASYSGGSNNGASQSTCGTETETVTRGVSTTALRSSVNPSVHHQPVTFTATVSNTDGGGTVAFTRGSSVIPHCGSVSLTPVTGTTYSAACTTSTLKVGSHKITASYSGDTDYFPSASFLIQKVKAFGAPAFITPVYGTPQSSPVEVAFARPLAARVTDLWGNVVPGAVVTFSAPTTGPSGTFPPGFTSVTTATDLTGQATSPVFTANSTVGGPYDVVASIGSISGTFVLTNLPPVPDTAVSIVPTHVAVSGGGTTPAFLVNAINTGSIPTAGTLTVTDTLSSGLTFTGQTLAGADQNGWSCTVSGQVATCTYKNPIPVGSLNSVALYVSVTAPPGTVLTDTATIAPTDPTPQDNTASTQVIAGQF
jgi:Bacterial Ig-like domain (group 3)